MNRISGVEIRNFEETKLDYLGLVKIPSLLYKMDGMDEYDFNPVRPGLAAITVSERLLKQLTTEEEFDNLGNQESTLFYYSCEVEQRKQVILIRARISGNKLLLRRQLGTPLSNSKGG